MQAIIKAKKRSLSQHAQKAGLLASVAFIAVLGTGLPMIAHAQTTVSQTISFNIRAQFMILQATPGPQLRRTAP